MDGSSAAGRVASKIRQKGAPVVLRQITRTTGPSPLVNPPETEDLVADGNWPAGSTTIALRSDRARGVLLPGDTLLLPTEKAVVAAVAASRPTRPNGFTAIALSAPLAADLADGAVVTAAWSCDLPAYGMITSYPKQVIDGDRVRISDLAVMIGAYGLPEPQTAWQILFAGRLFSIMSVTPIYAQATPLSYTLQAR